MTATIPLIRGFALLPVLSWLAAEGVSVEKALAEVDLPAGVMANPFQPVPLVHVAELLRHAAREHGPDLPCRIVSEASRLEIAMLGKVALGARSPAEALARIVAALPYYCSHEQVTFERRPGQSVVREFFAHRFDPETAHLLLQYAAAMIDRILAMGGEPQPCFVSLELPPHPIHGVEHLKPWYGDRVSATRPRGLALVVDDAVLERPYGRVARDRLDPRALEGAEPLSRHGRLSESVVAVLELMIENEQTPTMKRVVAASGMSARSFQRQLEEEETTFSQLLVEVRRSETLKRLTHRHATIASIAADLGYCDQATFTRAFRRWTGTAPGRFRAGTA